MHKRKCSHKHEGTNEAWLFNGQNFRCAVRVSEDYRPYRHKSRTLFFITPGRWQSKTLILSTNADQKSIKQGFLLSFVARLAIVNTVSCDYYSRSSIVMSVFNCRLPGMFNPNTARALSIARCCFGKQLYNCNCRYPEREICRLGQGSQIVCFL